MKEILEQLSQKYLFKTFYEIDKASLNTKKQMKIFEGVDFKDYYHLVFELKQKSHFLVKHAEMIISLEKCMVLRVQHNYKYKHLFLNTTLCSKALQKLQNEQWMVSFL